MQCAADDVCSDLVRGDLVIVTMLRLRVQSFLSSPDDASLTPPPSVVCVFSLEIVEMVDVLSAA